MNKIIINADDFGQSGEDNQKTMDFVKNGFVNSVSLMVNYPYFNEAVHFAQKYPDIDWGIHLTVDAGSPWPIIILKIVSGKLNVNEIIADFEKQIQKVIRAGLRVAHLDSHQHLHFLPIIFPKIIDLAQKYQIPRIRFAKSIWPPKILTWKKRVFGNLLKRDLHFMKQKIQSTDFLMDLSWQRLDNIILPNGTIEIITHPGKYPEEIELLHRLRQYV